MSTVAEKEAQALVELREALGAEKVRFEIGIAFSSAGSMEGVYVEYRGYADKRWKRFKTMIFPSEGENVADLFQTLMTLRAEVRGE